MVARKSFYVAYLIILRMIVDVFNPQAIGITPNALAIVLIWTEDENYGHKSQAADLFNKA